MDQIEYRTIGACLRPPRVAVAYRTRSDWVHSARQVVASLSRVWGGAGAVILPISEGGAVAEDLLPLLRAYDPDHVAVHVMTAADLAVEDPGVVGRLVEGFAYPGESRDETWARVSKEPIRDQAWAILAEQVDGWCSPLKGLQQEARWFRQPQVNVVHREGEPGADLSLLPAESGETVYALNLAGIDPLIALMVESRVGAPPRNAPSGLNVLELPVLDEDLPALIGLAISGRVDEGWDLHNRVLMAIGAAATADPPPALTGDEYLAGTPFSRTRRWLTKVRTTQPPPTVCVIGDTAEDHALAMLCDRTFHHGAWIPLKLLSDEDQAGRAARRAIRRLRWLNGAGDAPVLVVSASQSTDVLAELVEDLEGSQVVEVNGAPTREQNLRAALAGGLAEQPGRSLLADERSFHVRRTVPIRQMAGELSLLTPVSLPIATAVEQLGKDMVWFIDVWVSGHQLPARTGIPSSALLEAPAGSFPEAVVRASRYGLSFSSRNMGFVPAGSTLEGRLAHPVLRLPSAEQIFAELAAKHGGTVQRSPAGRRAANAVELWGSLAAITTDLAGDVRRLLDAFIPPPVAAKTGHYGAGYAIRGDGYLTLRHAAQVLRLDDYQARDLLDRLLAVRVLRRGLLLSCERCFAQAFHPIGSVGDEGFSCSVCGHPNRLMRGRWYKGDPEPAWNYALDQVVRELLQQHGDIPLLAAARLGKDVPSFLWAPELLVEVGDETAELDLSLIIEGKIVVGEAKYNSRLDTADKGTAQAAARLVRAAHILSADEIVLATAKHAWAVGARRAVEQAIIDRWNIGPRPKVVEVTGVGMTVNNGP